VRNNHVAVSLFEDVGVGGVHGEVLCLYSNLCLILVIMPNTHACMHACMHTHVLSAYLLTHACMEAVLACKLDNRLND